MKFSKLLKKSCRVVLMNDSAGFTWLCNGYWAVPLHVRVAGLGAGRSLYINVTGKPALLDDVAMLYWAGGQLSITYKTGFGAVVDCQEDAALDYLGNDAAFNVDCTTAYDINLVASIAALYKQAVFSSASAMAGGLSHYSKGVVRFQSGGLVFYVQELPSTN